MSTGTRIRIDSVMHPRSSSRGHNTSASVIVTVTVTSHDTVWYHTPLQICADSGHMYIQKAYTSLKCLELCNIYGAVQDRTIQLCTDYYSHLCQKYTTVCTISALRSLWNRMVLRAVQTLQYFFICAITPDMHGTVPFSPAPSSTRLFHE